MYIIFCIHLSLYILFTQFTGSMNVAAISSISFGGRKYFFFYIILALARDEVMPLYSCVYICMLACFQYTNTFVVNLLYAFQDLVPL